MPLPASLAFTPASLAGLSLPNRLIRAGCYEGLSREGRVTEALIDHHRLLAAGGLAMTTVGYCAVAPEGRSFRHELLMDDQLVPGLRRLTDAVHAEGFGFVQMGRATVRDPRFAARLRAGEITASDCDQCNRCIGAMEAGGVYCVTERLES